jgi:excisionase family DNA binding protein
MEREIMNESEYSVEEAADFLGANQETVRRHIRTGKLKSHMGTGKFWREYRIYQTDLVEFQAWYNQQPSVKTRGEE